METEAGYDGAASRQEALRSPVPGDRPLPVPECSYQEGLASALRTGSNDIHRFINRGISFLLCDSIRFSVPLRLRNLRLKSCSRSVSRFVICRRTGSEGHDEDLLIARQLMAE